MSLPFTTLDVFTITRYLGNPLAVIRVPYSQRITLTEAQKQVIAREFNYSETVFLHDPTPEEPEIADYDIFTPASRLAFAGHPTIGTAHYVASHADKYPGVTKLRTLAGIIPFEVNGGEVGKRTATVSIPHDVYEHKARLSHPFPDTKTNGSDSETVPVFSIVKGMAFNLVPMKDLPALALPTHGLIPVPNLYDREHLDQGSGWDVGYTGSFFYVDLGTDPEEEGVRLLRTRGIGSREDPGTGSASCALSSYLALREVGEKGGKIKYHLTQGVEMGRRCDIYVEVTVKEGGKQIESVRMSGEAVEVMEGTVKV
ncbi:Diaminopimelate epimerase-like protein [Periconia macrospinosa]|uniref:Diaminopimelate epimerase-like protein n=1 Tax=Periconia macrospinosa TaxID=97972 RepID=A0A2V1DZT0_9PLEO|nr:Diaminopimelate epimerase-like protein [Periconia macrospinosa]